MTKVAVILSGCGFLDGSEIHESVLTLLQLSKQEIPYQCLAPNIEQTKVVNHFRKQEDKSTRNVLVEAARIARGDILDVAKANANEYDALIFPGGFGAFGNLSNFIEKQAGAVIQADVLSFAKEIAAVNKPTGFICIAPTLIPFIYGAGVKLTIGNDQNIADQLEQMGAIHKKVALIVVSMMKNIKL